MTPATAPNDTTARPDGSVFWSEGQPRAQYDTEVPRTCDVLVVGAGYTGLWTTLELLDQQPDLRVCVVDAARVGDGASGRNGGWLEPSLTHGVERGERLFPNEIHELEAVARDALDSFRSFIASEELDCDFAPTGTLECAVAAHQLPSLHQLADTYERLGWPVDLLDTQEITDYLRSPHPVGAVRACTRGGILNPFALVTGLAQIAARRGALVVEGQRIISVHKRGTELEATASAGARVRASNVVLAVDGGLRRVRRSTGLLSIPLEDYVMVSAPLTPKQRASVGWTHGEGVADLSGAFTSLRLTADHRLYWGGSEAVYRFGSRRPSAYEAQRWDNLAAEARTWFPQLSDLAWTHRWTGAVPVTTSGVPAFGTALGGRMHYVFGFTGLGVLASKVAGQVLASRVLAQPCRAAELQWARRRALPFPPEPIRWAAVERARHDILRADQTGKSSRYLKTLDRFGMGFTS
ncbi:FAD-binding oxidoreductase [Mycolicibacterium sp. CH28]|uniref:NAD(P)/FAD-dependent oxidoreductase n=1 Tax=Mycolicibacterium sp. CH28 TaxID=2512237 RepID=UPI0013871A3D|nr:FAD-dependent oxidoreductase [Mycolicibacterium sp. CH28]